MRLFLKSLWGHFVVRYHLAFGVGSRWLRYCCVLRELFNIMLLRLLFSN